MNPRFNLSGLFYILFSSRKKRISDIEESSKLLEELKQGNSKTLSEVLSETDKGYEKSYLGQRREVGFPLQNIYKIFHRKDFDEEKKDLDKRRVKFYCC